MTEVAQTYLGNLIEDAELAERIEKARNCGHCLGCDLHLIELANSGIA